MLGSPQRAEADTCDVKVAVKRADGVTIRADPSDEAENMGTLPRGAVVHLVESHGDFMRFDNASEGQSTGWVDKKALSTVLTGSAVLQGAAAANAPRTPVQMVPKPKRVRLLDCTGAYLKVVLTWSDGKREEGFLSSGSHCVDCN